MGSASSCPSQISLVERWVPQVAACFQQVPSIASLPEFMDFSHFLTLGHFSGKSTNRLFLDFFLFFGGAGLTQQTGSLVCRFLGGQSTLLEASSWCFGSLQISIARRGSEQDDTTQDYYQAPARGSKNPQAPKRWWGRRGGRGEGEGGEREGEGGGRGVQTPLFFSSPVKTHASSLKTHGLAFLFATWCDR